MPARRESLTMIKDEIDYYQHQLDGIREGARRGSFILGDDMGLGKTLEALTIAAIDVEMGRTQKVLVVCPSALRPNWQEELDKYTCFKYIVVDGTPKKREEQLDKFEHGPFNLLVISYEILPKHVDRINEVAGLETILLDEAHLIKGPRSVRTKACLKLKGTRFIPITGTPMLNTVSDLWSLLNRINPRRFQNYFVFMHRYAVFGGYKDKQIVGIKNEKELHDIVQGSMIRRRKEEVLDLPEKRHVQIVVGLHPLQAKLYEQAENEMMIDLPHEPEPMELANALVKALRLKQICGTAATIEGYDDCSEKLDEVVLRLSEMMDNEGRKVIVFTQFRGVLECILNRLRQTHGIEAPALHGDIPSDQRQAIVRRWTDSPDPLPIVCMLQVAGVGLTMTAASDVFFVDKLWSPQMNVQAEDRAHRIGAKNTVTVYEFLCQGTIEYRVEQILRKKTKMQKSLIEDAEWESAVYEALKNKGAS